MYRPSPAYKKKSGHRNPKQTLLDNSPSPRSLLIEKTQSQMANLLPTMPNLDLNDHHPISPMLVDFESASLVDTTKASTNPSTDNIPIFPTKKPCPKCDGLDASEQCVRRVYVHRRKNIQHLTGVALTFAKEEERLPPIMVRI